jgi:hypothetical protein
MSRHISFDDTRQAFYRLTDILDVGITNYQTLRHHLAELRVAAMRLSNLAEQECNGVIGPDDHAKWDEQDQARNEKARQKAEDRASRAIEFLLDAETFKRLEIEFQPDPRGPSVILHIKNQYERAACFW